MGLGRGAQSLPRSVQVATLGRTTCVALRSEGSQDEVWVEVVDLSTRAGPVRGLEGFYDEGLADTRSTLFQVGNWPGRPGVPHQKGTRVGGVRPSTGQERVRLITGCVGTRASRRMLSTGCSSIQGFGCSPGKYWPRRLGVPYQKGIAVGGSVLQRGITHMRASVMGSVQCQALGTV